MVSGFGVWGLGSVGWSNNRFNNLHFGISPETNEMTTCFKRSADHANEEITICVNF